MESLRPSENKTKSDEANPQRAADLTATSAQPDKKIAELIRRANLEHQKMQETAKTAVEHACRTGRILRKIKEGLEHGQ
jgi:hypothetical protein